MVLSSSSLLLIFTASQDIGLIDSSYNAFGGGGAVN